MLPDFLEFVFASCVFFVFTVCCFSCMVYFVHALIDVEKWRLFRHTTRDVENAVVMMAGCFQWRIRQLRLRRSGIGGCEYFIFLRTS